MNTVCFAVLEDAIYRIEPFSDATKLKPVLVAQAIPPFGYDPTPKIVAMFLTLDAACKCFAYQNLKPVDERWKSFTKGTFWVMKIAYPNVPLGSFNGMWKTNLKRWLWFYTVT